MARPGPASLWSLALIAVAAGAQNHPELTWQVLATAHFRVVYHDGLAATARRAAQIAEQAWGPVTRLYAYEPDGPVRIVLKDYDDYANGAAFFYHDEIEIWTTPLEHDFELRGTSDWLRNVITHEFVHVISLGAARKGSQRVPAAFLEYFGYKEEQDRKDILTGAPDRLTLLPLANTVVPMWFAEGVAQYQTEEVGHDRWDSHRDMILRTAVLEDRLLSLEEMGVFGKQGFGNEFVYDHGFGLVTYLAQTYGDSVLPAICRAAARWPTADVSGAIAAATGRSGPQVWRDWRDWMRARYAAQLSAIGTPREGERLTDEGFSNTHPVLSPDGGSVAFLSTLKRHYGPHSLVVRDLDTGEDEVLATGVESVPAWDPTGASLVYVRKDEADRYGSRRADLFEWEVGAKGRSWRGQLLWAVPAITGLHAPRDPRERRLTRGERALYPAVSPDGRRIAFVRGGADGAALGIAERDGGHIRYVLAYDDGTQLYTPRWSPDGRRLAVSYAREGRRDIGLLDVGAVAGGAGASGVEVGALQPLVASVGTDRDPAWSADGRELVFASDIDGVFNIYAVDLASGAVERVTNVRGGAFFPTIGADGHLLYAGWDRDGFQLYRIGRGEATPVPAGAFAALPPAPGPLVASPSGAGEPPALTPAPVVGGSGTGGLKAGGVEAGGLSAGDTPAPQPYGTELLRSTFMPRLTIDEGHLKAGTYFGTGDALDRQSIFGGLLVAPGNGDRDVYAVYRFRGFRPTVRLSFIHLKRTSARGDSSEAREFFVTGMSFSLNRLTAGASGHLNRAGELDVSLAYDRYDASLENDQLIPRRDGRPGFERVRGKPIGYTYLNGLDLAFTYRHDSVARRRDRDINPRGGRRVYFRYDRMCNWFIEGFDEQNTSFLQEEYLRLLYGQSTLDWREYLPLPAGTTLGVRLFGGWIDSGRVDDPRVGSFFDFHLGGLPFMRGYTFYSIEGRKAGMANAAFRFPLLPSVGRRVGPFFLDKLYGAVYGDLGKAWDRDVSARDPVYGRTGPLRDAGAQLRLDSVSFYSLPTRVEVDVAYGIDEVAGKGPWKLYFTLLFNYIDWIDPGE